MHLRIQMAHGSVVKKNRDQISSEGGAKPAEAFPKLQDFRQSLEIKYFHDLSLHTEGDVKKACQVSGLSRSRLYELLAKYNISFSKG